jgi:hypothetical protein
VVSPLHLQMTRLQLGANQAVRPNGTEVLKLPTMHNDLFIIIIISSSISSSVYKPR